MKAVVYSKEGKKQDEIVLNPEIYAARVNVRLLQEVRNAYAANLRRGTADTKTRKEVRGGGKKPWKQKGTGRARAGSIRSPIWRGGGTVFGPHPRDYTVHLPSSMRRQAIISALSLRAGQKNLFLLESAEMTAPKTKEWTSLMHVLPIKEKRALCIVREIGQNLKRASRNALNWVDVKSAKDLNAYQILQREKLIIEADALPILEAKLLSYKKNRLPQPETQEAPAEKVEKVEKVAKVKKSVEKKEKGKKKS